MTNWQKLYIAFVGLLCVRLQCKLDEIESTATLGLSQANWAATRANEAFELADKAQK